MSGTESVSIAGPTDLIKRRHPRYADSLDDWDFFWKSYMGGREYIESNLFKYFKEGPNEFEERKQRAYRDNHTKRIVDLINSYLFKAQATRAIDGGGTLADDFVKNADGAGKSMGQFMKLVSQMASIYGRIYIVVDKHELPEEERTGTQADNLKAKPYCWILRPQDMLDLAFDDTGALKWALVREYVRDDDDPFTSTGTIDPQYRLWTRNAWFLRDKNGKDAGSGEHGLGVVPIVPVNNEEQDDYTGQSLIADLATVDRAIFNNWSRLDTIVNDQTFSQLIFPVEGVPYEGLLNDEVARQKFLTLATNRVLFYSGTAQTKPEFISPDASQAAFILSMIERQTMQLYASLGLQAETGTEVKAQSGVAKAYDFDKLNKLLASKADNLEEAEKSIYGIVARWFNTDMSIEVDYPDEFDVKSLSDEIALANELALLNISARFKQEIDKGIVLKALPKASQETIAAINEEIEANALGDEEAAQNKTFPFDEAKTADIT